MSGTLLWQVLFLILQLITMSVESKQIMVTEPNSDSSNLGCKCSTHLPQWQSTQRFSIQNGRDSWISFRITKQGSCTMIILLSWQLIELGNWSRLDSSGKQRLPIVGRICLFCYLNIEENSDCNVPSTYTDKTLANWVKKQRKLYKKKQDGEESSITDDQIIRLEGIGFAFVLQKGRRKKAAQSEAGWM